MARPVSILLVFWSLVATPVLCRAGIRLGCCAADVDLKAVDCADHSAACRGDDRPAPATRFVPDEADEHGSAQSPPCNDHPCTSCSEVCAPVATPVEHSGSLDIALNVLATGSSLANVADPSAMSARSAPDHLLIRDSLPFPASDIPLLI